ncbi:MAG: 2-phosphosulfolactate phosphatase [Lachnospiraceae bacterium]|nr:2-phosphosulfolactate phosphatase [Lachnospiraceae bacterium]
MDIRILHLMEGAKEAQGLTVIIDVFRAFSLECYLYAYGAKEVRPAGTIEEAFAWKEKDPAVVLIGERGGKKCEGFDFGNSPSQVLPEAVAGKRVIHTTSAGTQGVILAKNATQILGAGLVNAAATAAYIQKKHAETVSLVCMGNGGVRPAAEDELCALYIESLLLGKKIPNLDERIRDLAVCGGEHFSDPHTQEIYPKEDFDLCTMRDKFDTALLIRPDADGFVTFKEEQTVV